MEFTCEDLLITVFPDGDEHHLHYEGDTDDCDEAACCGCSSGTSDQSLDDDED